MLNTTNKTKGRSAFVSMKLSYCLMGLVMSALPWPFPDINAANPGNSGVKYRKPAWVPSPVWTYPTQTPNNGEWQLCHGHFLATRMEIEFQSFLHHQHSELIIFPKSNASINSTASNYQVKALFIEWISRNVFQLHN